MKIVRLISRIFVGLIFAYSGFVKALDPLGSTYKFTDYFNAFGLEFLVPTAFALAIFLSTVEFVVGLSLIVGVFKKFSIWMAFLFMLLFTPLTLVLAISNPVSDCGCFGDALILTNWETFWKNIIILIPTVLIFLNRKKETIKNMKKEYSAFSAMIVVAVTFSLYCYDNLPVIDFRPYKVGTYIPDQMVMPEDAEIDEYIYYYTMENQVSKEIKEIDSNEYLESNIWEDTTWVITETSEPILIKEGYHPPIHDFMIYSDEESDITDLILEDENYNFLLVSYKINDTDTTKQAQINELANYCTENGYNFICLTASITDEVNSFKENTNAPYKFYSTDEITLKTIVRANPGLVLLKKGTIMSKWHYNRMPDLTEFESNILK